MTSWKPEASASESPLSASTAASKVFVFGEDDEVADDPDRVFVVEDDLVVDAFVGLFLGFAFVVADVFVDEVLGFAGVGHLDRDAGPH